jgi:hypothetical protein
MLQVGTNVVSASPKNLRAYLEGILAGRHQPLVGKTLGKLSARLDGLSTTDAQSLLAQLGPDTTEIPPTE